MFTYIHTYILTYIHTLQLSALPRATVGNGAAQHCIKFPFVPGSSLYAMMGEVVVLLCQVPVSTL